MARTRRGRIVDIACVVACLALGALLLRFGDAGWSRPAAPPTPPWPVDAAVGAACGLLMWYRDRWPLPVALAVVPAGAFAGSATPALALAVFTVAVHRPAREAILVALADVASVVVYFALQADPRHPLAVDLAVRGAVVAGALGWGMFAGVQRRLVASLRERAARLEAEQALRVEQARLTERTRIAREMHDTLAHRLSLVSLHAGALEVRTDASNEEVSAAAAVIRTNTHAALQELRQVIGVLRAPPDAQPDAEAVAALVAAARAAGTPVDYAERLPPGALDGVLGRTVYRIVQEGLTNARKHAPGETATVLVEEAPDGGVQVSVTNPLLRPVVAVVPGAGAGLIGLAERVELAGGRIEHGRHAGEFRLRARLPWPGRCGEGVVEAARPGRAG
ncbi:MAG TPA: histidine kinase [Dactylosporangium sp.]|nr:histidine kinase [Dactylosporangium sp.]